MDYGNEKIVMYLHGGSGNHGCEAIVNSTCHMIEEIPKLLVTNSEQDCGTFFRTCLVLCLAAGFSRSRIIYALPLSRGNG